MDLVFTIGLVIILLVVGFFLFIFMPKPTVFFDPYTNTIQVFAPNHDTIAEEIAAAKCDNPVIPIYGFGEIKSTRYPKLYELLRAVPYVRFAGLINIKPKFYQAREYGVDRVANHTIRYFYTIKESAGQKSGVWIDGTRKFFSEKTWICGDMSREHALFNKDKQRSTTVLFIDIDRHDSIHEGRSPNHDIKKDEIIKIFDSEWPDDARSELTEGEEIADDGEMPDAEMPNAEMAGGEMPK